uniref:INCENP_ARK-bind domain-containing protein n=1 Tax=Angiostrongylus cantonensis TaxID=6313 RepID=A0A0K0D7Z7_ANGCA
LEINEEKPLCTEEQENMAQCLNTSSSMKLHNRHLDNVIMNVQQNLIVLKRFSQTSNVSHKSASRHSSYEITRGKVDKPLSENNYSIEDLSSGDETDQEEAPRKKVPSWAVGKEFQCELRRQAAILRSGEFDLSEYFGEVEAPDLALIFGKCKTYPRRGSSAIWESPIARPRQGIGAFQNSFARK